MIETILTALDDSLIERVNSYLYARYAFNRIKADKQRINDKESANSLGTDKEIEQAYQLIQNSLVIATQKINQHELKQAQALGLMTDKQVKAFLVDKNLQTLRKLNHHSHSHKKH